MSPSLPSLLGLPSFDTTLGAVLLGLVVGIMCVIRLLYRSNCSLTRTIRLYGITVYQAYKYYTVYTDDGIRLKLYVRGTSPLTVDKVTDGSLQITVVLCVWCPAFVYWESLT